MKQRVNRALRFLIIAFAAVDVILLLLAFPYTRSVVLAATGRSQCPLKETGRSFRETQQLSARTERFRGESRVVAQEDGLDLWETPKGRFWTPAGDTILPFILAEQDMKIYGEGERGVRAGDVVLDCGANLGAFTRSALDAGARLVIAVEPAPLTLKCLRKNLESEIRDGRVIVYPKGVWDRDDWLTLAVDDHNAGSNSLLIGKERERSVKVPLTTIDKLVYELALDRLDFIKMDIEGAEKQALAGASATLNRFKPRMSIAAEHFDDDATAIPAAITRIAPGYRSECGQCLFVGSWVRPHVLYFF